jgi:hypothetical protein
VSTALRLCTLLATSRLEALFEAATEGQALQAPGSCTFKALVDVAAGGQTMQPAGNCTFWELWLKQQLTVKLCEPLGNGTCCQYWLKPKPTAKLHRRVAASRWNFAFPGGTSRSL